MKLNKLLIGALLVVGASNVAMAANTITFSGTVNSQTCTVNVGGSASPTVLLPTVGTGDLTASGNTAGATTFTVGVTGCTSSATPTNLAVRFAAHGTTGQNLLSTGTATNVAVQLVDGGAGGTPLNFTTGQSTASTFSLPANSTTATSQTLAARYYATGAVGAGSVTAVADYEIIYP